MSARKDRILCCSNKSVCVRYADHSCSWKDGYVVARRSAVGHCSENSVVSADFFPTFLRYVEVTVRCLDKARLLVLLQEVPVNNTANSLTIQHRQTVLQSRCPGIIQDHAAI